VRSGRRRGSAPPRPPRHPGRGARFRRGSRGARLAGVGWIRPERRPEMTTLALGRHERVSRRTAGIALAFATAVVSGVSIYVNSRAVKHFGDATVYTTAKNAVAGALLLALALAWTGRARTTRSARPLGRRQWLAFL